MIAQSHTFIIYIQQLFLLPEWALSQQPFRLVFSVSLRFFPPPPPPLPALFPHPCYGTRSPASLFLAMVHERNVREPLLPHSLRKARPCIMFTQNTHRNSGKFNWKFDKKILSHTHRFSDRNKIHNKKKEQQQGIKRNGKNRDEREQKEVGEKRDEVKLIMITSYIPSHKMQPFCFQPCPIYYQVHFNILLTMFYKNQSFCKRFLSIVYKFMNFKITYS